MQLKRNNTPYDLATVKIKLSKKLDTFADGEMLVINLNDGKSIIGCKNNNQIDLFDIHNNQFFHSIILSNHS